MLARVLRHRFIVTRRMNRHIGVGTGAWRPETFENAYEDDISEVTYGT
jgi:hypothetical protein